MLGKVSDKSCRLNVYLARPEASIRAFAAEGWGYGQVSDRKCLIVQESGSGTIHVLGVIVPRSKVPREDLDLMKRVRIVEEGLNAEDRAEWSFIIDDIDDQTKRQILAGPYIEPHALVGSDLQL